MDQNDTIRAQWVEAFEASELSQEEFARQHGLPARTLRSWRRRFRATRQPPPEVVREAVEQAILALTAVRDRLDAACRMAHEAAQVEARNDERAVPSCVQPTAVGDAPPGLPVPALSSAAVASAIIEPASGSLHPQAWSQSLEAAGESARSAPGREVSRRQRRSGFVADFFSEAEGQEN
jgi:transposase-like protein